MELLAWTLCMVTAIVGLTFKDARYHGVTLAISAVMLWVYLTHHMPQ